MGGHSCVVVWLARSSHPIWVLKCLWGQSVVASQTELCGQSFKTHFQLNMVFCHYTSHLLCETQWTTTKLFVLAV